MSPIFVIVWLIFGIASGMIAQAKGLPFGYYFLWGLLFGPIGLIVSLCVKPARRASGAPPAPQMGVPGRYLDPYDQRYVRYWDGMGWTQQLHPLQS
jgi:hypothetical protein